MSKVIDKSDFPQRTVTDILASEAKPLCRKGKCLQFFEHTVDRKGARRMRLSHFFLAVLLLLFTE